MPVERSGDYEYGPVPQIPRIREPPNLLEGTEAEDFGEASGDFGRPANHQYRSQGRQEGCYSGEHRCVVKGTPRNENGREPNPTHRLGERSPPAEQPSQAHATPEQNADGPECEFPGPGRCEEESPRLSLTRQPD